MATWKPSQYAQSSASPTTKTTDPSASSWKEKASLGGSPKPSTLAAEPSKSTIWTSLAASTQSVPNFYVQEKAANSFSLGSQKDLKSASEYYLSNNKIEPDAQYWKYEGNGYYSYDFETPQKEPPMAWQPASLKEMYDQTFRKKAVAPGPKKGLYCVTGEHKKCCALTCTCDCHKPNVKVETLGTVPCVYCACDDHSKCTGFLKHTPKDKCTCSCPKPMQEPTSCLCGSCKLGSHYKCTGTLIAIVDPVTGAGIPCTCGCLQAVPIEGAK